MNDKEKQTFLNKKFNVQLDKTMSDYANYQIDRNDTYPSELSVLNGINKKLNELQTSINKKNVNLERSIKYQSSEIEKYKAIEKNLKNMTSIEDLDATSKQMLADSVNEYKQYTIIFWIKVIFILVIFSDLIIYKRTGRATLTIGLFTLIYFVYVIYKYVKK